jgi:3-oxoacyl-[acyl-carrier-protein] synthase-3
MVDTSDEWIRERTGISKRYIVKGDVATSDLVVESTYKAVEDAGINLSKIDAIIVATAFP